MKKVLILSTIFLLPVMIFAADTAGKGLEKVFGDITTLLGLAKNIIFALAFLAFFYGLMRFIFSAGDDKDKGKDIMIWGIIALFVMFSIMGIIKVLQGSFGDLDTTNTLTAPKLEFK